MKVAIGVILALILAGGGYWAYQKYHEHPGNAVAEHPGNEAEHPGKDSQTGEPTGETGETPDEGEGVEPGENDGGDEGKSEEHPGSSKLEEKKFFTATDIKIAIRKYISGRTDTKTLDGIFQIYDSKEGKQLNLRFVKIHDPVRILKNQGYFACTDFEVIEQPGRLYDLDFWLNPKNNRLVTTAEKIHKHPADNQGGKVARYTFKNEEIVDLTR